MFMEACGDLDWAAVESQPLWKFSWIAGCSLGSLGLVRTQGSAASVAAGAAGRAGALPRRGDARICDPGRGNGRDIPGKHAQNALICGLK